MNKWKKAVVWVATTVFNGALYGVLAVAVLVCFAGVGFYAGDYL